MARNRLIPSTWDHEGMLRVDTVDVTLNTESRDRPSTVQSVGRCTVPGVTVMWRPRQSVRSRISCNIMRSLSLSCFSPGAHTFISCVPFRTPSVLPKGVSCGFPIFSSRKRNYCVNEGRKAGSNDSRVRVRTSLIPLSHINLDTRFTLCWVPPRVHHCSRVRSQLGCFDSVCQSPDISLQRWAARRSCLVAAIKLRPSFVSPKMPTGSSDVFILHT